MTKIIKPLLKVFIRPFSVLAIFLIMAASSAEAEDPPSAVDNLYASPVQSYGVIRLTWTAVVADEYKIKISTDSEDKYGSGDDWWDNAPEKTMVAIDEATGGGEEMEYQIEGLEPGATYYAGIKAYEGGDPSECSNIAMVVTKHEGPGIFTFDHITTTSILWTWEKEPESEKVRIYSATDTKLIDTLDNVEGERTTYDEAGLSTNTVYGRFVRSVKNGVESLDSNHSTWYTHAAEPKDLELSEIYVSSVSLSWNANGNPEETEYEISYHKEGEIQGGGFDSVMGMITGLNKKVTKSSTTVRNLDSGNTYFFEVWAVNGDGRKTSSVSEKGTTELAQPPQLHSPEKVSNSDIRFKWYESKTPEANYIIEISESDEFESVIYSTPVENTEIQMDINQQGYYHWRVGARTGEGLYNYSQPWELKVDTTSPYGVSMEVVSVSTENEVLFKTFAEDNYTEKSDIEFIVEKSSDAFENDISTGIYLSTGVHSTEELGVNTPWWFRARAVDEAGNISEYSSAVSTVTYARPPENTSLDVHISSVTVSWEHGENPAGTVWSLLRSTDNFKTSTDTLKSFKDGYTSTEFTDTKETGIRKGEKFYWKVAAYNHGGVITEYDVTVSTLMPNWPRLKEPPDGYITNETSLDFEWGIVSHPYKTVAEYHFGYTTCPDFDNYDFENVGKTRSHTWNNIEEDVYYWSVRAYYGEGEGFSEWSPLWSVIVDTTPPDNLELEVTESGRHSIEVNAFADDNLSGLYMENGSTKAFKYTLSTSSDFEEEESVTSPWADSVYRWNELTADATYWIKVKARDMAENESEAVDSSTKTLSVEYYVGEAYEISDADGRAVLKVPPSKIETYGVVSSTLTEEQEHKRRTADRALSESIRRDIINPRRFSVRKRLDGREIDYSEDIEDSQILIRLYFPDNLPISDVRKLRAARLNEETSRWEYICEDKTSVNKGEKYVDILVSGLSVYTLLSGSYSDVDRVYVYPNPYMPGDEKYGEADGGGIRFANLPEGADIRIFNVAGELVDEFTHPGGTTLNWGRADEIASGVYMLVVNHGGDVKLKKFSVVK